MADESGLRTIRVDRDVKDFLDRRRVDPDESYSDVLRQFLPISVQAGERARRLTVFMRSPRFSDMRQQTERYLAVLGFLCQEHGKAEFERQVLSIRKRHRVYVARSAEEIENSGDHTQPRPIPGTSYWALTNMRLDRKLDVLGRVLAALGYDDRSRTEARKLLERGLLLKTRTIF